MSNNKDCVSKKTLPIYENEDVSWSSFEDFSVLNELEKPFDIENDANCSRLRDDENYEGFDNNVGTTWIYPINKPIRTYQLNISKSALFRNTLVVLPTGLGKTFIAAVVMYNIYRWYPKGKIIFMAPTRPLVTQQIEACCTIMGIPETDIAEMTGKTNKTIRRDQWQSNRLFFATPQVVQLDLVDPELNFPFKDIKLIVVDEAHKAKGRYAYVDVVQSINERNHHFRILALSATPGRNIGDVVEIIKNLFISHIEVRYENSIDVAPYTHKKNIKTIVIPLGEELISIRDEIIDLIDPYLRALIEEEVVSGNINNMSKGWLLMEQKRYRERSLHQRHVNHSKVAMNFSICVSLYHALELLERHGVRVLINYFEEDESTKEKFFVNMDPKIKRFVEKLRTRSGKNPLSISDHPMINGTIPDMPVDLDFGHPKFEKARDILLDHFQNKPESRAIIFCEFRESVMLMHRILLQNRPLIKPRCFVGQGGTGSLRAVTQAQQIKIMKEFRDGLSNTLIATSVAEEGIDVGEVDLIICFDISTKNPTRLIQRIGRTGRMRNGKVVMLATEGKENSIIKEVLANKDKINIKLIKCREIKQVFYNRSPRLVPPEFDPKCVEVFMKENLVAQNESNSKKKILKEKKTDKKKNAKKESQSSDVRNYFKRFQPELSQEDLQIFDLDTNTNTCEEKNKQLIEENIVSEIQKEIMFVNNVSENYVVSQFDNTEYENELLNTSAVKDLEKKYKKLNHMARHLDKDLNVVDYTKNIDDLLKLKNTDNIIKKYVLLKNGNYVKEKLEAMKVFWTLDEANEKNSCKKKVENEKKIRESFRLIENILGDRFEIEQFVKNFEDNQQKKKLKNEFKNELIKDIENALNDFEKPKSDECLDFEFYNEYFEKYKETIENDDIYDSSKESKICDEKSKLDFQNENSVSMYELEDELDLSEVESKYSIQFTQFKNENVINQSTPKQQLNHCQKRKEIFGELQNSEKKILGSKFSHSLIFQDSFGNNGTLNINKNNNLLEVMNDTSIPSIIDATVFEQTNKIKENKNNFKNKNIEKEVSKSSQTILSKNLKNGVLDPLSNFEDNRNNLKKNSVYEVSADLFNDDFDHLLIESENIINNQCKTEPVKQTNVFPYKNMTIKPLHNTSSEIFPNKINLENEKQTNKINLEIAKPSIFNSTKLNNLRDNAISDKTKYMESNENQIKNFNKEKSEVSNNARIEQSMMTISQILDVVTKKESPCGKKLNVTNPELEDFDINDFLNPFEEEEENFISSGEDLNSVSLNNSVPDEKTIEILNEKIQKKFSSIKKPDNNFEKSSNDVILPDELNLSKNNKGKFIENFPLLTKSISADSKFFISPKKNNTTTNEISPSLIKRSTSLLKLRNICNINKSQKNLALTNNQSSKASKCLDFNQFSQKTNNHHNRNPNDETILKPLKGNKRILSSSDSETENNEVDNHEINLSQVDVIVTPSSKQQSAKARQRIRAQERKRLRRCKFLDDEAGHSSPDSKNDETDDLTNVYDSIVVQDDEADDQMDMSMYVKYLESTKNQSNKVHIGGFKIPAPRQYNDMSRIFSQPIEDIDDTLNCYKGSFIVSDEEESDEVKEMSPLSKAEAILKKRKYEKRKKQSLLSNQNKRRRILNNIIEISDDEDE